MDKNEEISRAASHCPNCGAEYRAGFDTCADCGLALMPGPAPVDENDAAEGSPAATGTWAEATRRAWSDAADDDEDDEEDHPAPAVLTRLPLQEAMLLVGRLEEAGIPARVESDESPYFVAALNVLKNVLVPMVRLENAKRVLDDIQTGRDRI